MTYVNKISVFMIKDLYQDFNLIIQNDNDIKVIELDDDTHFYYTTSFPNVPEWIRKFFLDSLNEFEELKVSSAKGVLLRKIQIQDDVKIFAIVFGHGRFLLNSYCFEERFGLKTALSIINPDTIRRVDKKDISNVPKHSIEQRSKVGNRLDFGINIEQDLIQAMTGLVKAEYQTIFGSNVTGGDALSLSAKYDIQDIDILLEHCYNKYNSGDYKEDFEWIDQIAPVKNIYLVDRLNNSLLDKIKTPESNQKVWMAVPEIIDWEDIGGFKYHPRDEEMKSDIFLPEFKSSLDDATIRDLNLNILKSKKVYAYDTSDNERYSWSAYECLYAEIEIDGKIYLLSNSAWFEIDNDFVSKINTSFQAFIQKDSSNIITLNNAIIENECDYNTRVADEQDLVLLDKKMIYYGGGHSQIEFCDLLSPNKEIIHIKKYGGSSVLSHLFNQGLVSAELLKSDRTFIEKVNERLEEEHRFPQIINTSDYKIVFGVISEVNGDMDMPFFSKISLKNVTQRLENLGYDVYLQKINVIHNIIENEISN